MVCFDDRQTLGPNRQKASGAAKSTGRKLLTSLWFASDHCTCKEALRVALKGNAIIITKQASGTAKIELLMAAFNAVAWMSANPASSLPSIFVI
jgi:phage terminase large subunit-like protein